MLWMCFHAAFYFAFPLICINFVPGFSALLHNSIKHLHEKKKPCCLKQKYIIYMHDKTKNNGFAMPAEWHEQDAVQLTWPHEGTDWKPILDKIIQVYVEMAVEIARREKLIIVSPEPEKALGEIEKVATPDVMANIVTFECPTDDTWARDHGFITLLGNGSTRMLDFKFNGWGEKFAASKDNAINRRLYDSGMFAGSYADDLDFVLEGGSIESDGRGTVFTTSGCLLAPHRNQPMARQEIENRLKKTLCAKRIVWIDHGNLSGDDTDGHIDTLVRVAPDDTLLYVGCDDPEDEQYEDLQLMERQLRSLRTADGRSYRLLKLPMPRKIVADGERLPATYANFLPINGAVLCPVYGQPDLDSEALSLIAEAFPGRKVVGIDCRSVVVQHGSLHCCTMQFPKGSLAARLL